MLDVEELDDALMDPEEFALPEEPDCFKKARDGDYLMCPFQCDRCSFLNVQGRRPIDSEKDKMMPLCIRRCTLDSFWSRETSTVAKNLSEARQYLAAADVIGLERAFWMRGPFPLDDDEIGLG